ncbi:hypothetical protein P3X46_015781 [Hevea brasiliensis]|uniref:Rx N-terminal domain-containing protein n=1 Tax=Hevea brasiliensis TaxID=3981 RepID=A0ABQ9LX66_HEVBR|nr:hypothetical protein P3X46_015781 [Hevea brasiliensis]
MIELHLSGHLSGNNFEILPASIKQLPKLAVLVLRDCKRIQHLPELPPGLEHLDVRGCISLRSLAGLFTEGQKKYRAVLEWFDFCNCMKLDQSACSKIMDDARLRIQCMATSLVGQELMVRNQMKLWNQKSSASTMRRYLMNKFHLEI